jgi:hypothetical protein
MLFAAAIITGVVMIFTGREMNKLEEKVLKKVRMEMSNAYTELDLLKELIFNVNDTDKLKKTVADRLSNLMDGSLNEIDEWVLSLLDNNKQL